MNESRISGMAIVAVAGAVSTQEKTHIEHGMAEFPRPSTGR